MSQAATVTASLRDAAPGSRVGIVVSPAASVTLCRAAVFAAAELTVAGMNVTTLAGPSPTGDFDGFIWATPSAEVGGPPNTVVIHEHGVPATHLDVSCRYRDVGRVAAEHLLSYGRSRLVLLPGPADDSYDVDIARGFQAVAPASPVLELTDWQRALAHGERYDGVLAVSAASASAILQTLRRRRITVPGEVAVIAFDHAGLERVEGELSLTTVALPSRRMGSTAARMLIAALAGRRIGTTARTVSPVITARKSAPRAPRLQLSTRSEALIS